VAENPKHLLDKLKQREKIVSEALPKLIAIKNSNFGKRRKKPKPSSLGVVQIVADAALQPVLIANEGVEIMYVNQAWEKQFGYSIDEVKGENPRILASGQTKSEVYKLMWQALKEGKIFQTDEVVDKRKDGTHFNLMTTIFQLQYQDSKFYIQILDDITERKRVKELHQKFILESQD
jgi:two-component system sensor histidine kinase/response regulator